MSGSNSSAQRPAHRAIAGRRRFIALAGLLTAGCGFELRRAPKIGFRGLALEGFGARSPLADELSRSLARSDVRVEPGAAIVLHAIAERRDRSVVASTAAGQVRELQLRLSLEFRVDTRAGKSLIAPTTLLLSRDLSYTESYALAKEQEEAELFGAMQGDIASQVVRRLAALSVE